MIQVCGINGKRCNHPIHSFLKQIPGIGYLLFITFSRMGDQQIISGFCRHLFNSCKHRINKVALQFMNNTANRIGLLTPEISCKIIGSITHLFRQIKNPFAGFQADQRIIF